MSYSTTIPESMLIRGLSLQHPSSGTYNTSTVLVSPGRISFSNKDQDSKIKYWNNKLDYYSKVNYTLTISVNGFNWGRLDSIYAYPLSEKNKNNNIIFSVKTGIPNENPTLINYESGMCFLGCVYVPGLTPSVNKRLYIRSKNKYFESISTFEKPIEWQNRIVSNVEKWQQYTLYFKNQIVRNSTTLYRCKRTHSSPENFATNQSFFWESISGGSGCDCFVEEVENDNGVDYVVTYLVTTNQGTEIKTAVSSKIL